MFSHNTMGHVARGLGNNDVGAVLKQVTKISNVFARGTTLFDTVIQWQQMAHPGAKRDALPC